MKIIIFLLSFYYFPFLMIRGSPLQYTIWKSLRFLKNQAERKLGKYFADGLALSCRIEGCPDEFSIYIPECRFVLLE